MMFAIGIIAINALLIGAYVSSMILSKKKSNSAVSNKPAA